MLKNCTHPLNEIEFQKGTFINQTFVNLLGCDTPDNLVIVKENVTMKTECFGVLFCFVF